jgi:hypothetical protein
MQEDVVDSSNDMPQHLWYEVNGEYPRGVLTYIADMRALLQSSLSSDILSVRVVTIACKILQFRRAILYLSDDQGGFLVRAMNSWDFCCSAVQWMGDGR